MSCLTFFSFFVVTVIWQRTNYVFDNNLSGANAGESMPCPFLRSWRNTDTTNGVISSASVNASLHWHYFTRAQRDRRLNCIFLQVTGGAYPGKTWDSTVRIRRRSVRFSFRPRPIVSIRIVFSAEYNDFRVDLPAFTY